MVAQSHSEASPKQETCELSRFLGMVIHMRFEAGATPQFYVRYGEHHAKLALDSMRLLEGFLSPRVLGLVCEWSAVHRSELVRNWWRLSEGRTPLRIEPLY